jgi:uncharacterized protein
MSPLKPTNQEEEYFARQEALKLRKLMLQTKEQMADEERKKLKELHWMCCPKCGMKLKQIAVNSVEVDKCFSCGGMFLDDGELEKISGRERNFFDRMRDVFKDEE